METIWRGFHIQSVCLPLGDGNEGERRATGGPPATSAVASESLPSCTSQVRCRSAPHGPASGLGVPIFGEPPRCPAGWTLMLAASCAAPSWQRAAGEFQSLHLHQRPARVDAGSVSAGPRHSSSVPSFLSCNHQRACSSTAQETQIERDTSQNQH